MNFFKSKDRFVSSESNLPFIWKLTFLISSFIGRKISPSISSELMFSGIFSSEKKIFSGFLTISLPSNHGLIFTFDTEIYLISTFFLIMKKDLG